MPLGFRITGDEQTTKLVQRLNALGSKGLIRQEDVEGSFQTISELALTIAKKATPGSGRIRNMWELSRTERAAEISWLISNVAEPKLPKDSSGGNLLSYLEFGTRAHIIRPKTAKALRFMVANSPVFAKLVRHPGTKPYAMIGQATAMMNKSLEKLIKNIERKLANVLNTP